MIIDIFIYTTLASIPAGIFFIFRAWRIQKTYQEARELYWNNKNYNYYVKHTWNGAKIVGTGEHVD